MAGRMMITHGKPMMYNEGWDGGMGGLDIRQGSAAGIQTVLNGFYSSLQEF
jgi:hypothetical protein